MSLVTVADPRRSLTSVEFLHFLHPEPPNSADDACVVSFWKRPRPGGPVNVQLGGIRTDQITQHWPKIEPYLREDLYYSVNALCWFPETRIRPNPQTLLIPWKRNCRTVRWLLAFFVDLDWHDGPLPSRAERLNVFEVRRMAAAMPAASAVIFTPHGLQALWRVEPVRSLPYAQRKWQTAQSVLIERFGSDPACKEAHRLLRLPGCRNPETGIVADCEVIDQTVYSFEQLCDLLQIQIVEKAARAIGEKDKRKQTGGRARYQVLADGLLQIIEVVWKGRIPQGKRHNVVWMLATMLRRAGHPAEFIEQECLRVGRAASLSDNEILRRVRAVTSPPKQELAYEHRSYDRLCRVLGLTHEQRKMVTAWFGPRVRRRTLSRAQQRATRAAERRHLQMRAQALKEQGLGIREIAAGLGIPRSTVHRLLQQYASDIETTRISGVVSFGGVASPDLKSGFCTMGTLSQNRACWIEALYPDAPANPLLGQTASRKSAANERRGNASQTA